MKLEIKFSKSEFSIFQLFLLYRFYTKIGDGLAIFILRIKDFYLINFYYDFEHKRFRFRCFFRFNKDWIFV